MNNLAITISLLAALGAAEDTTPLADRGDAEPKAASVWMKQKLQYSQKIFAGLTMGDLVAVEDDAKQMKLINRLESFVRGRSNPYRTQLKQFQFANDEIIRGAREKNIERVTLGYNQLSVSCVMCHKHLRERK